MRGTTVTDEVSERHADMGAGAAQAGDGYDLGRDIAEARAYGTQAAALPEWLGRSWAHVAPLLAAGWAGRHAEVCCKRHDWRLSFPAVRAGWHDAGRP
jgi:hypothetical protein